MNDYTVKLELPDCEGTNPREAVESFRAQAAHSEWVYKVTDNATGAVLYYDDSDGRTFTLDADQKPVYID